MSVKQSSDIYQERLSSLNHGLALWDPKPVENIYNHVSIGDVGYLLESGAFMRLFNVTLPWDDPSNTLLEVVPEEHKRLELGYFINIHSSELREREYCSHVCKVDNIQANTHGEGIGQMYECQGQAQGALLCLPHGGHSEDVIRTKVFEDYIRDNVDSWFRWSRRGRFPVERMEDLILVTGSTLVASWAAAVFDNSKMSTAGTDAATISLDTRKSNRNWAQFSWYNNRGNVDYHNSDSDTTVQGPLHRNQCVFLRGFRARRVRFRTRIVRAAAEPLPDDPDNHNDDEIQVEVTRIPDGSKDQHRDPFAVILDYIEEKCQEDTRTKDVEGIIAITHDDDLQLFEHMDSETVTADSIERLLREKKMPLLIENGAAILRDPADDRSPVFDDDKVAIFYAVAGLNGLGESVPLEIHPVLTKYLLKLEINGPIDHDYDLPKEDMTSPAVYPHMQSLNLEYFRGCPQVINIQAFSDPRVGITVQDVLRKVHEDLRMQLRNHEFSLLGLDERAAIRDAFEERCKIEEERRKGPSKIDLLRGRDRLQILPKFQSDNGLVHPTAPALRPAKSLDQSNVAGPSRSQHGSRY